MNKGCKMDLQTRIKVEDGQRIYVDEHDGGVWMSLHGQNGSSNAVMTKEQAEDMIVALIRIVDGEQS
jgi:hypothetical protein